MNNTCIYSKSTDFSEAELYKIFSKYGNIKNIQIIKNNDMMQIGTYIDFDTSKNCERAFVHCNNLKIGDKTLGKLIKLNNLRNFRLWKNICTHYNVCVFNLYGKCKNSSSCGQHHITFEELGYIESLGVNIDLNIFCPKKQCCCIKEHNPELTRIKWVYNIIMVELNEYFKLQEKKKRLGLFISKMNLEEKCVVCLDNIANGISTCSHKCCKNCWGRILCTSDKCPMCRKKIEQIIYMDEL